MTRTLTLALLIGAVLLVLAIVFGTNVMDGLGRDAARMLP